MGHVVNTLSGMRPESLIYTPTERDDEHSRPFHVFSSFPPGILHSEIITNDVASYQPQYILFSFPQAVLKLSDCLITEIHILGLISLHVGFAM